MMYRTCTVQANLDFSSEADMVKKLRVSLALQPVATALFANSPFTEGKPNGFLCFARRSDRHRQQPRRHAALGLRRRMGFERYTDYALGVPMYFVKRGDTYMTCRASRSRISSPASSTRCRRAADDFGLGQSPQHDFPEVRLKRYLEMRGADGGPWRRLPALSPIGSACCTTMTR